MGRKPARKKVTTATEARVLIKSARRCVLCYHLKGRLTEKNGQVAHIDHDRTNGAEDNLVWMCLLHHSKYDSRNSQHKNYTAAELKDVRGRLYKAIERGEHWEGAQPLDKAIGEIMEFLEDDAKRPTLGPEMLRFLLHDKIGDLAEWWFRRGFNRGHIESYKKFQAEKAVPRTLEYDCLRNLSPGQNRSLTLKHTMKKTSRTASGKRR